MPECVELLFSNGIRVSNEILVLISLLGNGSSDKPAQSIDVDED